MLPSPKTATELNWGETSEFPNTWLGSLDTDLKEYFFSQVYKL